MKNWCWRGRFRETTTGHMSERRPVGLLSSAESLSFLKLNRGEVAWLNLYEWSS